MDEIVKKELKATTKKTAASFAPWVVVAALFCCGGPIVLLILFSGGAAGVLGFLSSNIFLIWVGFLVFIFVTVWMIAKFKIRKYKK